MTTSIRIFLESLLLLAGLALVVAQPAWLRTIGIEVATLPTPPTEGHSSLLIARPPEGEAIQRRCAAKAQVVGRIWAGEMDLFEAAAWFRHYNHEPPEYRQLSYLQLPGQTDEEKLCRQVIQWVGVHLRAESSASEVDSLVAHLEATLAARLRVVGRIDLPEKR